MVSPERRSLTMPKAVFVGCARSCGPYLDGVLANVEALGSTYDWFEVIVVENDSVDDTRQRLQAFASARRNVRLIEADGLEEAHPRRGDRLAVARNLYLEALRDERYSDCDDVVVLDFDDVNCRPIDLEAFKAARRWLWEEPNRRGVFANTSPFYYDLWALRHPTWCPDDCWKRVREAEAAIGLNEAIRRHVTSRQVPIPRGRPPIMVDSAFGGLGIYRREATLRGSYVGLDTNDEEVCDHVSFNAAVKGSDGILAIYPGLQNECPLEHILTSLYGGKTYTLEQDGKTCTVVGPPDHQLQSFRAVHPLYDRRLPALARIISDRAPNAAFIDVGANIGDTIALARLAGARMPVIAIDASLTYCKYLWVNVKQSPSLFGNVRLVWGYVGADGAPGEVALSAGTAGPAGGGVGLVERAPGVRLARLAKGRDVTLVKTDTDGFDQEIIEAELAFLKSQGPILWLEAQTMSGADEAKWRTLLHSMAAQWNKIILFDNFGRAIAAGETSELADRAVDLMASARRQREQPEHQVTLYYLDLALFPQRFADVYEAFRQTLPELNG
jgi:glycosyltransferase involved in cell wall biosynthesis